MAEVTRTRQQIEDEIAAARDRLASNLEGLITQAHPKAVLARGITDVRDFATEEVHAVRSRFVAEDGSLNLARLGALALALAGSVAFLVVVRSLARR